MVVGNKDKRPTFESIIEELQNNKEFINKDVDGEEFKNYIENFDEYFNDYNNKD